MLWEHLEAFESHIFDKISGSKSVNGSGPGLEPGGMFLCRFESCFPDCKVKKIFDILFKCSRGGMQTRLP